jgi:NADPH:quinone reductase-like Zn-dependent oxidoreductase
LSGVGSANPPLSRRPWPRPQVGQAVACNGASSFAEYAIAKAPACTPVPAATPEAVALVLSAVTAAAALEGTAKVSPGDTVLVTAAAGGTGHFAVQLAKLAGARVIAVTGSLGKVTRLRELGADVVICHRTEVGAPAAGRLGTVLCSAGEGRA